MDLIGPDGREYVLDQPEQLQAALDKGFRLVTPEAPKTTLEQAKGLGADVKDTLEVGAHGALQGLTGGLFGVMEGKAAQGSGEYPARDAASRQRLVDQQKLREEHPVANAVGELGGALVSPLGKLQTAITKGIGATTALGRIGANIVGGGAVGSLYGAGNTLSDAALGDHDLTAEKLFAGAGLGAVLGGGAAGLGSALEEGARAVLPRVAFALKGAKDPLSDFADERWLKAGGGIQSSIKKIPEAERPAVANVIREAMAPAGKVMPASLDEAAAAVATEREAVAKTLLRQVGVDDAGGLLPKMDRDAALEALGKAIDTNGARVGAVLKQADQLGAQPSYSSVLGRIDAFEVGLNPAERDIASGAIDKTRQYLMEMGSHPVGSPKNSFGALNDLKTTLQGNINYKADSGAKNQLEKQLVGIIRDEIDTQLAPQIGSDLSKEFLAAKASYGALAQAEKALGRKTATGADAIAALVDGAKLAEPSLAGKLSALDHATTLISHGLDRNLGNRFISASDYLTGIGAGVLHGGPMGVLSGLATSVGHKIIRERGSAVIAKLADTISRSPQLSVAAQSFGAKLATAAPQLGQYAPMLERAFATSPAMALATHMTWARADPQYAEAAQTAGFLPETPEEHESAMFRAGAIAGVAHVVGEHDAELDRGIERVLKGKAPPMTAKVLGTQDFGAKRMRRSAEEAHKQRMAEIQQLAADPVKLVDKVAANLGHIADVAPGVAAAVTRTAHTAVAYLASQIRTPPKTGPLAAEWVHSDADIYRFSSILQTAQDPMSVLRHAAAGTLTDNQVQALKAVYPRLAQQMVDRALEQVAAGPKEVPYRSRLMLAILTGVDLDGSLSPAAVARNQAVIHATQQSSTGAPQPPGERKSELTLAKRTALPNQQREMATDGLA